MKSDRVICPLGAHELLVETSVGTWLVVPSFNIDVAIGAVRDGVIEAWTTRLVQECLRPGLHYFNAGANYGYYAILGAQIVGSQGHVYAVEPNPHILPMLMKGAYWSGVIGHVSIYNRALWYNIGESVEFHFDPQYLGGGSSRSLWGVSFDDVLEAKGFTEALWSAKSVGSLFDASGKWMVGKGNSLGALGTIESNPQLKLITEWSSHTYKYGSTELRGAFDKVFSKMIELGYRVRHLEPRVSPDGGIYFSEDRDFKYMTTEAVHGDYFWTR
jgi:hypothetical protein